ncbi:MAG: tetratricopeptide repeat protein, partial [Trichodesmium sp. MAG_R02]|nr:tetratricopeptide repeat protein [Trichodesmium sp. MAG_R02]
FAEMAWRQKKHQYEIFGRQKLIEIQPNNPKNYHNLGDAYFRNQKYEKALEAYTQAIKLNPNDGLYYSQRANAHEKLGNYEQSKLDLQKARQKNTDFASKRWLKMLQLIP